MAVREQYDDDGISGGTMDQAVVQWLLESVEDVPVDVVVVFEIDRLGRSLTEFTMPVELFFRKGVHLISVTQSLDMTSAMGRLSLNILLSLARFGREATLAIHSVPFA